MLRMVSQKTSATQYADNINLSKIVEIKTELDRQVEKHGYHDIFPWLDIAWEKFGPELSGVIRY